MSASRSPDLGLGHGAVEREVVAAFAKGLGPTTSATITAGAPGRLLPDGMSWCAS